MSFLNIALILKVGLFLFVNHSAIAEESLQSGPAHRFVINGEYAYDIKTDLTWKRCSYGQVWREPSGCTGKPTLITFDDAKQLEKDGWRIPTLDELNSIVITKRSPTIDSTIFPNTPPVYYWATDNRDKSAAWYVFFENGRTNHYYPPRTNRDVFRMVRTGKL